MQMDLNKVRKFWQWVDSIGFILACIMLTMLGNHGFDVVCNFFGL